MQTLDELCCAFHPWANSSEANRAFPETYVVPFSDVNMPAALFWAPGFIPRNSARQLYLLGLRSSA